MHVRWRAFEFNCPCGGLPKEGRGMVGEQKRQRRNKSSKLLKEKTKMGGEKSSKLKRIYMYIN